MKSRVRRILALTSTLFLTCAPGAFATSGTWNVDAASSWGTATNWTGSVMPGAAAGDTAAFSKDITAARTITLDGVRTLGSLTIGDPGSTYYAYTLSAGTGGQLVFNNNASGATLSYTVTANTAANTISAPVVLNDNLTINSAVANASNPTQTLSGIISDGSGAAYSISKTGAGLITLSGANTYRGGTTISSGKITASNVSSFGPGDVGVSSGGQAYLSATTAYANNFNIAGTGCTLSTAETNTGNLVGAIRYVNAITAGTITVNSAGARLGAVTGNTGILNGTLTGTGALEINSITANHTGTITINGGSSGYTGTMTVSQGTLKLGSASALGGNLVAVDAAKLYANNIALDNAAPTIAGSLTLGSSTGTSFYLDPSTANVLSVGGNLSLVGTNNVYLTSVYPGTAVPVLNYAGSVTAGSVAANLGLAGGIATYRAGTGFSTTGTGPHTVMLTLNPGNVTWTPSVTSGNWDTTTTNWTDGGVTGKTYYNGDNVTFGDASAATTVTIASGVTVAPTTVAFSNSSATYAYTLAGSGTIAGAPTITKSNAGRLNLTSTVTIGGGGIFNISGGTVTSANTTAVGVTANANLSGTITLGDTTNYGALTFTGTHSIANGANITAPLNSHVLLSGPTTLPASFTVTAPFSGATYGSLTISGTTTMTGDTAINAPSAFNSSNYLAVSGVLTDGTNSYKFTKSGAGCLRFQSANTYHGGTLISGGLIWCLSGSGLGSGDVTITGDMTSGGGQVVYANGGTVPNNFIISGAGQPLSGDTAGDGAIQNNYGPTTFNGNVTLAGNARITSWLSYAATFNGNIAQSGGSYSLDLGSPGDANGCGTIVLNGNDSYAGGTNIYRTITRAYNNNSFGTGTVIVGGDASATLTTRVEVGTNITLPNNFTLSSVGKTDGSVATYGEITGYPGNGTTASTAIVNGNVNITATPANGGHFASAGSATTSILRVMGTITSSIPVKVAAGIVEFGGSGTGYTAVTEMSGTLRPAATNGIATTAVVDQGASGTAILDLNGFNQSLAGLTRSTGSNTVSVINSGSAATLTFTPTADFSYPGTFGSAVNLSIGGTAVTSLSADSSTTFTGATTVTYGGTLNLTGKLGTTASTLEVNNGGTLKGNGTIGGSLTMDSGSILAVTVGSPLTVNGPMTVSGSVTVKLTGTPSASTVIINAPNGLTADPSSFILDNAGSYNSPHFEVIGNQVLMTTGALSLTWTGNGGNVWNAGSTANWTDGSTARAFYSGDAVTFNDSVSTDQTIQLPGAVNADTITFNNSLHSYTIAGITAGALNGTSLSKSGTGTATINAPLSLTGGMTLNGGNLVIQTADYYAGANTLNQTITGTGLLTISGGTAHPLVSISGSNTSFSGGVTISRGQLEATITQALGSGTVTLGDANSAPTDSQTLTLDSGVAITNPVLVSATAGTSAIAGPGTVTGSATLTKKGTGTLTLSAANTYTGTTTIVAGAVNCTTANAIASGSTITLGSTETGANDTTLGLPTSLASPIVLSPDASSRAVINRNGGTHTGTITLNGRDLWVEGSGITFGGAISGNGNLKLNAAGSANVLTSDSNSFAGDVYVLAGAVQNSNGSDNNNPHNCIPATASVIMSSGTTFYAGANETINGLTGTSTSTVRPLINLSGFAYTFTLTVGGNNGNGSFDGHLVDQDSTYKKLAFTKTGTGTQSLNGTCTATGPLTVDNGTLLVNGTYTGCANFNVNGGAVIGGTGTITANLLPSGYVSIAGHIAPGNNGIGTLTINNNIEFSGTGAGYNLKVGDWNGNTAGTDYDTLVANAIDFFGGNFTVALDGTNMTNFTETDKTFVLVTASSTVYNPALNSVHVTTTNFPGLGLWTVKAVGHTLVLQYTAKGFGTWMAGYPSLTGANALAGADPDHDGITNLQEYVLGGDPTVSSQAILPVSVLGPDNLVFTYTRSHDSIADTKQYVQWTNDFAIWNDIAIPATSADPVEIIPGTNSDTVNVTISRTNAVNGVIFARLKVTAANLP